MIRDSQTTKHVFYYDIYTQSNSSRRITVDNPIALQIQDNGIVTNGQVFTDLATALITGRTNGSMPIGDLMLEGAAADQTTNTIKFVNVIDY